MHGLKNRIILTLALACSTAAWAADAPTSVSAVDPGLTSTRRETLEAFVGVGYLGSPGANGSALSGGLRLRVARHLSLGLDLGYGVVQARVVTQDRWWMVPTAALVIPAGPVRIDLGIGVGLGASSGYTSWSAYVAAPFTPVWAFQLVPVARAHVAASMHLSQNVDLFARAELAGLLLDGTQIGFRDGNAGAGIRDTTWLNLSVGFQFGLL